MPRRRLDSLDRHSEAGLAVEDMGAGESIEQIAREEELQRINAALRTLSRRDQIAIQLRINDGMSFGDIGKRFGVSREKARQMFTHCISALRERID
jgi:RNA polymerase sigma factor (sigma-70 family)